MAPKPKGAQPNKKNDSEQSASGSSAESSNEDGNEAETKGRKGRSVPNATKGRLPKPAATKKSMQIIIKSFGRLVLSILILYLHKFSCPKAEGSSTK